ncbi:MAG TPA: dipeptidase [Candidatus Thermoplasmatota archaeon]|nr:dipeptidase [Candidatus Thermoplasmatota archaeon]
MPDPVAHARARRETSLAELFELLRIPSVSAQPERAKDMERAATWVADAMRRAGLENVEVVPTGARDARGHPWIYGDWLHAEGAPTVLVYGHYDVQPAEPLELWHSPAFEPTVRDGKVYARGATDDKGQMFTHIKGVEAHLAANGRLPVNVKFMIEGEEEVGSRNLEQAVRDHAKRLAADVVLISDSSMWDEKHPSIVYSLRGLAYFYVTARGAAGDLHSGTFGGAVPNAVEWLAKLLAAAKDPKTGRVLIPGFYEGAEVDADERKALAKLPFNEAKYRRSLGLGKLFVEKGWTPIEATTVRPTFEVNGFWGGYIGAGQKTVLPNEAHAKVSMRLVGRQDPQKVGRRFRAFVKDFEKRAPGIRFKVEQPSANPPAKVPIDHRALGAGVRALEGAFPGTKVVFAAEGGSIPVVGTFADVLGVPTVLMGFGLHDENLHAPNEHIRVANFERGIEASVRFFDALAKETPASLAGRAKRPKKARARGRR